MLTKLFYFKIIMVIVELYSRCLRIKYKNYLLSKASLLMAIATLLNIVVPFIFSYNSRGFWLKHDIFYEQPSVRFRGEYLFIAYTNKIGLDFICNNFAYNKDDDFQDNCTEIKVIEKDNNFDGKVDTFHFELSLYLPENISVTRFDLLLTLDYRLTATCGLHMQTLILLQEIMQDTNQLDISSILKLSQLYPIFCHPKIINTQFNNSIIDENDDIDNYKFNNIIERYYEKNVTTYLLSTHKVYKRQVARFSLNLKVKYPEHMFYYVPTFWQIMKWAWIQYLSVFIIFWWVIKKIKEYIFDNHIVVFYEENPLKCKQD